MKKALFILCILVSQSFYAQFNYQRTWATYYGGSNTTSEGAVVDSQGNIYLGTTVSNSSSPYSNGFVTPNAHQTNCNNSTAICMITKFNPNGQRIWSTFYGGDQTQMSNIGIDSNDNIYISGLTGSTTGIATPNAFQTSVLIVPNQINENGFIAKFNSNGILQWGTYYPSAINTFCNDSQGNIYITGQTERTNGIATTNTFQPNFLIPMPPNTAQLNGFLTKFDTNGNRIWGTYYGLSTPVGIAVDELDQVYLGGVGAENTPGFYATPNCYQPEPIGSFLTKFNPDGQRIWSTYYEGGIMDLQIIRKDIYIAGWVNAAFINVATPNAHQTIYGGGNTDVFLAKFTDAGQRVWGTYYGGSNADWDQNNEFSGRMISFLGNDVYLTSSTQSSNNIATTGAFKENYSSGGNDFSDNYIVKFNQNGERIWGTYYGGENIESASGVIPLANNSFYIYGSTNSTTGISTSNSQQSALNSIIPNATWGVHNAYLAKFEPLPLAVNDFEKDKVTLFPNPNNGSFNLTISNSNEASTLEIYDIPGQLVYQQNITKDNPILTTTNLKTGVYFVKIKTENKNMQTIKMIVK